LTETDPNSRVLDVYLDDGVVYSYGVTGKSPEHVAAKAREHASAIAATGYRHNDGEGEFVHFPPHRISKIKITGGPVPTDYVDSVRGT